MFRKVLLLILIQGVLAAEIPYSLETLLNFQQKQGFHVTSFWEAMQWGRDDTAEEFYTDRDVLAVKKNFDQFCKCKDDLSHRVF